MSTTTHKAGSSPSLKARLLYAVLGLVSATTLYGAGLKAQDVNPPTAAVSPQIVGSSPATITIDWCDDVSLVSASKFVALNGTTVTSSFSYSGTSNPDCGAAAQSVGTLTLQQGVNTLEVKIRDGAFNWLDVTYEITYRLPPVVVPYRLSDGATVGANAGASNAQAFLVKNPGNTADFYFLSNACTGSVTCGTISPSSLYIPAGDSAWASMSYTGGSATSTGVVKLHATDNTLSDDGWVNVTNQYLNVNTDMNGYDKQSLGLCEASCFTAVQSLTTVPYFSMNQPRSVTLAYSGDRLAVRPFVYADISLTSGAGAPSEYWLEAKDSAGTSIAFLNGDTKLRFTPPASPTTTVVRLGGQFDATSYPTGVHPIKLIVTWATGSPASASESRTVLTNFQVVNDRKSPVARGWSVAGLQRLYPTQGGVLIVDGPGSSTFFLGCGTGCYVRPQGEFSSVTSSGSGGSKTYTRAYPDSSVAVFNSAGLLQRIIGRLQDTVSFTYDGSNRLTQITDPIRTNGGSTHLYTQLSYGTYGLSSIQEPGLFTTQSGGRTTSVSVASDSTLTTWTDPDNVPTRLIYDGNLRLFGIANRRGDTTSFNYREDGSWKLDTIQSPRFTRDDGTSGRITTTLEAWQIAGVPYATTASTMKTPIVRDSIFGKITDQGGHITRFSVNRLGQALKTVEAFGTNKARVTTRFMNATYAVLPDSLKHHEGGVDRFTYNADGLVVASAPAGESAVNFRYGSFAQIDSIWGTNRPTQRIYLGARGRVDSVKYAGSHLTKYTYDSRYRVLTIRDPANQTTNVHYESTFGNADTTSGPGDFFSRGFDGMGRDTVSQAAGRPRTRTLRDALNRVVRAYRDTGSTPTALPDSVRFIYDSLYLRQVKDGLGQTYQFQYNGLGLVTQRTDPASGSDFYAFDAEGSPLRWINRRGDTVFTSYDALHRIIAKTGTKVVADSFALDSAGRKSVSWNLSVRDSAFVDANGWTDSVVRRFATDASKRFVTKYTPDSLHRLTTMVPSTNAGITFATREYSWSGTDGTLSTASVGGSAVSMGYTANFIRSRATSPGNLQRNESRTAELELYRQTYSVSGADEKLWRRVQLDAANRVNEAYMPDSPNVWKTNFKYDAMGRLVQAADSALTFQNACDFPTDSVTGSHLCTGYTPAQLHNATWAYDAVGNVTSVGGTDFANGSPTYTTGNRLASWPGGFSFAHDSDGNITSRDSSTTHVDYRWSADGLLTAVIVGGDSTLFDYDPVGLLVRRRKGNSIASRHFWWDGGHLLAELDSTLTGRVGEYAYYPGVDQPMVLLTGATAISNKYYYQQDALGTVYGLVDTTGAVVWSSYAHVPWGDWSIGAGSVVSSNRLKWKGLFFEGGNSQLYYVRARWYDPRTHRFLSEDPIGVAGGMNPYAFASNDPVNLSDPSGALAADSRGLCSILLDRCPNTPSDLEIFESQTASSLGAAMSGPLTVTCRTASVSECQHILGSARGAGLTLPNALLLELADAPMPQYMLRNKVYVDGILFKEIYLRKERDVGSNLASYEVLGNPVSADGLWRWDNGEMLISRHYHKFRFGPLRLTWVHWNAEDLAGPLVSLKGPPPD